MLIINEDGIFDDGGRFDLKVLKELQDLFQFVSPGDLRKTIEYYFFNCEMDAKHASENKEMVTHIYYLFNFLDQVRECWERE